MQFSVNLHICGKCIYTNEIRRFYLVIDEIRKKGQYPFTNFFLSEEIDISTFPF